MKHFFPLRLAALLAMMLMFASGALAQAPTPTPHPLVSSQESIFSNKGEADLDAVKNEAKAQMSAAPFYKSNGEETRFYEGYFKAATSTSKLALLSDDGTSVWIDGQQVLSRAGTTQGFEGEGTHQKNGVTWQNGFDATFYPLAKTFEAGHIYHLKLQYTNTIHTNDVDVDGLSLWAYDGGGEIVSPTLELKADPTDICAGAISSAVHQSHLTAKLKSGSDTLLSNQTVHFSWKMPGASTTSEEDVAINENGEAPLTITSGDEVGKVTVTATSEGISQEATVSLNLREGEDTWFNKNSEGEYVEWDGDADTNGAEHEDLRFNLNFDGTPVDGHKISWRISKVVDAQGNSISPNSEGLFVGYGHVSGPISTTNNTGAAYAQYYPGTKEGIVTFEVTDHSVFCLLRHRICLLQRAQHYLLL